MKKILLLLSLLISVYAQADIARSVSFNFYTPTQLNPPITPEVGSGQVVNINNVVFSNGHIQISFDRSDPSWVIGAQIFTFEHPYTHDFSYYLRLTNGTKLIVRSTNGSTIKKIYFTEESGSAQTSSVGSLDMDETSKVGIQSNLNKEWDAFGANVSQVIFHNHGNISIIQKMIVEYSEPSTVLYPVWSNYANHATIPEFSQFNLRFNNPITLQNAASVRVSHKGGNLTPLVSASGDTLKIGLAQPIATDDSVWVSIGPRAIRTSEGYENVALDYVFRIHEIRSTFNCESITPAPGHVTEVPNTIKLKFPKPIKLNKDKCEVVVFKDNDPLFADSLLLDATDEEGMTAVLTFNGHYTALGTYRFEIEEGAVHTTFYGTSFEEVYDRWNAAISMEYEISNEPEPEPEPEPQPEDSEMMKAAKQLLTVSGVGYPAEDAPARAALKELTEAQEIPADADIETAIKAFYAETKVTLPTKDEWYQIVGVNSENDSIYVTLEDEGTRATVSKDKAKAAMFQAVAVDDEANTVVFATKDGKYLHVLSALPNYDKTSASNLTDEQSDVNKLVFEKFTAQSLHNEEITDSIMFGKFTMKGLLGTNEDTETDDVAYARLNYAEQGRISTALNVSLSFAADKSHAFIIKQASEPTEDLIDPVVLLEKDSIGTDKETLTLHFYNVTKVLLKDVSLPYFKLQEKDSVVTTTAPKILTAIENSDNEFLIHVNGLQKNAYELVMPVGTFDFSKNAKGVQDKKLTVAFKIGAGGGDTPDDPLPDGFMLYNAISWLQEIDRMESRIDYVADYELNDFILFNDMDTIIIEKNDGYLGELVPRDTLITGYGLYADPNKQVRIAFYFTDETIATGHFEPIPDMSVYGHQYSQGIRLVLDNPIEKGLLDGRGGQYSYVVPAGTYGDSRFAKYLQDPTSISPSECKTNKHIAFSVMVDNEQAQQRIDGIKGVKVDGSKHQVYDLQGRRYNGTLKPGLYIIDGKKRVIR